MSDNKKRSVVTVKIHQDGLTARQLANVAAFMAEVSPIAEVTAQFSEVCIAVWTDDFTATLERGGFVKDTE